MTSIKNHKPATVLVVIAALAGVLVVSTSAIGSGHIALADTITKNVNNTGVNVPTNTDQNQDCKTGGGGTPTGSPITGSCTATSTDTITQSGGILKK